jgi:hypothetical protein
MFLDRSQRVENVDKKPCQHSVCFVSHSLFDEGNRLDKRQTSICPNTPVLEILSLLRHHSFLPSFGFLLFTFIPQLNRTLGLQAHPHRSTRHGERMSTTAPNIGHHG